MPRPISALTCLNLPLLLLTRLPHSATAVSHLVSFRLAPNILYSRFNAADLTSASVGLIGHHRRRTPGSRTRCGFLASGPHTRRRGQAEAASSEDTDRAVAAARSNSRPFQLECAHEGAFRVRKHRSRSAAFPPAPACDSTCPSAAYGSPKTGADPPRKRPSRRTSKQPGTGARESRPLFSPLTHWQSKSRTREGRKRIRDQLMAPTTIPTELDTQLAVCIHEPRAPFRHLARSHEDWSKDEKPQCSPESTY